MDPWGAAELLALLMSVGFGTLSAVLPLANAEAYVIASQVSAVAGPFPIAISVGVGQTIGKCILFLGVRRGKELKPVRAVTRPARPVGPARTRLRAALSTLLALVNRKRWGLPIVGLAALAGVPPLFAVALLAGSTKMRLLGFAVVVLVGRTGRFVLVALGVGGMGPWLGGA